MRNATLRKPTAESHAAARNRHPQPIKVADIYRGNVAAYSPADHLAGLAAGVLSGFEVVVDGWCYRYRRCGRDEGGKKEEEEWD